jgi:LysR family transcriptional regulator for metE and metH
MQKNMTHHNIVIDIQCHACFQWLLPIIQKTSNTFPFYEFEFGNSSFWSNHQSQADLLFSDDENNNTYNATQKIDSVELLAILPKHHALTQRKFIDDEDFALRRYSLTLLKRIDLIFSIYCYDQGIYDQLR